jgi:hypothetical protein
LNDPAKPRYFALLLVRAAGVVMVMAGLLAANERIALGRVAGMILAVAGLLTFAVLPKLLARRWRSPK